MAIQLNPETEIIPERIESDSSWGPIFLEFTKRALNPSAYSSEFQTLGEIPYFIVRAREAHWNPPEEQYKDLEMSFVFEYDQLHYRALVLYIKDKKNKRICSMRISSPKFYEEKSRIAENLFELGRNTVIVITDVRGDDLKPPYSLRQLELIAGSKVKETKREFRTKLRCMGIPFAEMTAEIEIGSQTSRSDLMPFHLAGGHVKQGYTRFRLYFDPMGLPLISLLHSNQKNSSNDSEIQYKLSCKNGNWRILKLVSEQNPVLSALINGNFFQILDNGPKNSFKEFKLTTTELECLFQVEKSAFTHAGLLGIDHSLEHYCEAVVYEILSTSPSQNEKLLLGG